MRHLLYIKKKHLLYVISRVPTPINNYTQKKQANLIFTILHASFLFCVTAQVGLNIIMFFQQKLTFLKLYRSLIS